MKKTVVVSHQNNAHSVYVLTTFTLSVTSQTKFKVISLEILRINVNISEGSDWTYSKKAHSLYFLMISAGYSGDVLFIFAVSKIISTQV